ncbi:MAG TPA: 2-oxoacid:ferredoxin oxidoreductase subunit beta [bacterium (Candidatus Stahlbacteria)]|nr:2-oxoacid:ferredoxin oxidoreductase subunit beta [Candidatus Stahlbacteria bacterium]
MSVEHPVEKYLRMDRIPHIWCSGCGIGTTVMSFITGLIKSGVDLDRVPIVSGIGCTGRVAGYIKLDSFHTTHGRPIPFATGLKLGNPDLRPVVYSGDGDLIAIGGNHFIHAARRNIDLLVICINNFNYAMTGGQLGPTTPITAISKTTPYGNFEYPFNIPLLAEACGAVYVARWTALHIRRVANSVAEAMQKKGFRVIEIITPCVSYYARPNRLGQGIDVMKFYHDNAEIRHFEDVRNVAIKFQQKVICGKFVDRERPSFLECISQGFEKVLGAKYVKVGGKS